jgi:hypothetical protein
MNKLIIVFLLTLIPTIATTNSCEAVMKSIDRSNKNMMEFDKKAIDQYKSLMIMSLVDAVMTIESNKNPMAYNVSEKAAGCLQIRPVMLDEINRVIGYNKYSYSDRWDKNKSIQMFIDYQNWRNPNWNFEMAARTWNGGHWGMNKAATKLYWAMVKSNIKEVNKPFVFNKNLI